MNEETTQQRRARLAEDRARQRRNKARDQGLRHDAWEYTPKQIEEQRNRAAGLNAAGSGAGSSSGFALNQAPAAALTSAAKSKGKGKVLETEDNGMDVDDEEDESGSEYEPLNSNFRRISLTRERSEFLPNPTFSSTSSRRLSTYDIADPQAVASFSGQQASPNFGTISSQLFSNRKRSGDLPIRTLSSRSSTYLSSYDPTDLQTEASMSGQRIPPSPSDTLSVKWNRRNGENVPQLASAQMLDTDTIAKMNGIVAAHVFEKQGPGFFSELFRTLQRNDTLTWRRCMQVMTNLMEEGKERERFEEARQQSNQMELENHSYMVPEDYVEDDSDDSSDESDGSTMEMGEPASTVQNEPSTAAEPQDPTSFHVVVTEDSTCQSIMADFDRYVHLSRGRRLDSAQRALEASSSIRERRIERSANSSNALRNRQLQVQQLRQDRPRGVRSYTALRNAFDHISGLLQGPKGHWKNSDQWFRATMDAVNSEPALCNLMFEFNTHHFLDELHQAMAKADEQRATVLLEKRSFESYADLMGQEQGQGFADEFFWL